MKHAVSRRILQSTLFKGYLQKTDPDIDWSRLMPDKSLQEKAFVYLDDLAERRNEVAHGALSQILSHEILLDYITFFEAYGPALHEVVYESSLHYAAERGIYLGEPINVYNNKIVCISVKNTLVRVGDLPIAKTSNRARPYLAGEIQELQVDNIGCEEVPANPNGVAIGMRVGFNAKENQFFFLVPKQV